MNEAAFQLSVENVAFLLVSATLMASGLRVVTAKNLIHSVLWLGVTLAMTAVIFILLRAPFIAGVQLLLYTGGVITLMLFGVMLTHRVKETMIENESEGQAKGALVALGTFLVMATAILNTEGLPQTALRAPSPKAIGQAFLTEHLFAFEVLSVLLLIVMIGTIVLARKKDFGDEGGAAVSNAPESSPEEASA